LLPFSEAAFSVELWLRECFRNLLILHLDFLILVEGDFACQDQVGLLSKREMGQNLHVEAPDFVDLKRLVLV
jgi:hypothetical protein